MSRFPLLILCVLFMAVPAAIVASQPAPPADLLDALRLGGYVIVLRHGATNADVAKDGMSNPNKKPTGERQLSDAGRAQAIAIGEGLRKLGIRVGLVMTSPLQRAVDTATLLGVGEVRINPIWPRPAPRYLARRTTAARTFCASWSAITPVPTISSSSPTSRT